MKALIQRSLSASVTVDGDIIGKISHGLVLLIGIEKHDTEAEIHKMTDKVLAYRVFPDDDGKMNLNVQQAQAGILAISQFTLAANTRKGLRPSFSEAASPEQAKQLYQRFIEVLKKKHDVVETGQFGADMKVALVNDGPVTFLLEC